MVPSIDVHSLEFWVGNAKLSAAYFCSHFGFRIEAESSLENGERSLHSVVCRWGNVRFIFTGAYSNEADPLCASVHAFLRRHGDAVRDVALVVEDVDAVYASSVAGGAKPLIEPCDIRSSIHNVPCRFAQIGVEQWVHTLYSRDMSNDLPARFRLLSKNEENCSDPCSDDARIDHVAFAIPNGSLESLISWYCTFIGFRRFINTSEQYEEGISISSSRSAMRTMCLTSSPTHLSEEEDYGFKLVFVEPLEGSMKSQIEEFLDYHNGSGIAHAALACEDIVQIVQRSRDHGVSFIDVPETYYELREGTTHVLEVVDNWTEVRKAKLLIDFENRSLKQGDRGEIVQSDFRYLLQTFTEPLQDRPTFYLEFISRHGASGFGRGNIGALFEAIELLQQKRGNLLKTTC